MKAPRAMPMTALAVILLSACSSPKQPAIEHAVRPGERIEGQIDAARGEAVLRFRDRPLLAYAFAQGQFKPYVRELYTLRGENVLQDAPADHLHHHGLMYAIRVNGVNFWEERPPAGRQVPVGPPTLQTGTSPDGRPEAVLRQEILWQPPGDPAPAGALLKEERTLVVRVHPGLEEVALDWTSRFEVASSAERVVLHGADYNGLGLRLPASFDRVAEFRNGSDLPYSEAQTWDVRPVAWTSAAGVVDGREVMVAMAAEAANPGTSTFFTMRNAFAYVAAAQNLGGQPIAYRRGDTWRLQYRVAAYPAHQNPAFLEERLSLPRR